MSDRDEAQAVSVEPLSVALDYYNVEFLRADALDGVDRWEGESRVGLMIRLRVGDPVEAQDLPLAIGLADAAHLVYQVMLAMASLGDLFAEKLARLIYEEGAVPMREEEAARGRGTVADGQ